MEKGIASVIEGAFVFPGLVYALGRLAEFIPLIDDYDWVYYLKNIVDDYAEVKHAVIDPEYKMDMQQIFEIANYVFRNLHTDLLIDTSKVIDQAFDE